MFLRFHTSKRACGRAGHGEDSRPKVKFGKGIHLCTMHLCTASRFKNRAGCCKPDSRPLLYVCRHMLAGVARYHLEDLGRHAQENLFDALLLSSCLWMPFHWRPLVALQYHWRSARRRPQRTQRKQTRSIPATQETSKHPSPRNRMPG